MKPGLPSLKGLYRLLRLIRQLKPDMILGWMYHSCFAAQLARIISLRRTPVLWSIHTSIGALSTEKRLTAAVIKVCALLSRLPEQIIFVSRDGQAQHRLLGYRVENSCVIPNGINVAQFVPSAEARLSVRSELGLPETALLIGLTGRYHPMKDHSNFLRAAALIAKIHPETHFLMSGRSVNRENRILSQSIEELGLTARTHLLGERDDMPRLTAALDIFSLSSLYGESFPNVIGEAMACGVPSVVTDVGDAVWIVGDTGRVVPPGNPTALASAWKQIIDLGPEGRVVLGQAARARVINHFPLTLVVARYEELYEDLLAKGAPEKLASAARLESAELSCNCTSDTK